MYSYVWWKTYTICMVAKKCQNNNAQKPETIEGTGLMAQLKNGL